MAFGLTAAQAVLVGTVGSAVVGSALADDYGAEGANDAAADSTRLQAQIARDQWNRYKEIYAPLEQKYVDEAMNYDSPENYSRAADEASTTTSSQFGKARDRLKRTPGLDPSSAGYSSAMVGLDLAQAATDSTQQNAARQRVRDTAYARKTDALSLGKGLPANAASTLSSVATQSLAQANAGYNRGAQEAQAYGNVINRVVNSGVNSGWFGANPSTPQGGVYAPGGASFGSDLGYELPTAV